MFHSGSLTGILASFLILTFSAASSAQENDRQKAPRDPSSSFRTPEPSDLAKENLDRVAASADQLKEVLVKDAGILVELKRWVAKEATDNGQIVEDSSLTDQTIFDRLERDIAFRSVATRLVQRYGLRGKVRKMLCAGRKAESAIRSGKGPAANPPPIARVSEVLARQRRREANPICLPYQVKRHRLTQPGRFERAQAGKMRIWREARRLKSVRQLPWMGCGVQQTVLDHPRRWVHWMDFRIRPAAMACRIFLRFPHYQIGMKGERFPLPKRGWGAANGSQRSAIC